MRTRPPARAPKPAACFTPTAALIAADPQPHHPAITELAEGPYFALAIFLDAATLCSTDAACRLLRQLNRASIGPWRALGARVFHGLALEWEGTFEQPASIADSDREGERSEGSGRKLARVDWKGRFRHFRADVPTFCPPFGGHEIVAVAQPDEVANFKCRLCADVLGDSATQGVYLEVEVLSNPDNLSMAVTDFEAGGCNCFTFSPDTGAVIRERKVRETPGKIEGAYIQPLPTVSPGRRFHGFMGLYLRQGHLAFFRRCLKDGDDAASASAVDAPASGQHPPSAGAPERSMPVQSEHLQERGRDHSRASGPGTVAASTCATQSAGDVGVTALGPWETTGFVTDLSWALGRRLTPCLAFRDEGSYRVRVVRVGATPPLLPQVPQEAAEGPNPAAGHGTSEGGNFLASGWRSLDWEAQPPLDEGA